MMKELKKIFILLTMILQMTAISCGQESRRINTTNEISIRPTTILPKLLWKSSISEGHPVSGIISYIIHNNAILCNGQGSDSNTDRLLMIDIADGSLRWECFDIKNQKVRLFTYNLTYKYKNMLLLRNGPKLYTIDIENGKIIWQKMISSGFGITMIDSMLYFGTSNGFIWKGNIFNDKIDTVFSLKYTTPSPQFPINVCESFQILSITKGRDTLLLVPYLIGNRSTNIFEAHLLLYNVNKRKTIYCNNINAKFPDLSGKMEQYKDNIYITVGRTLACHNIKTGKQIWKKEFQGTLMSSGMIIRDGRLFLHSDEYPPQTYAIEPLTGKELWKQPSIGTIDGQLFYMNGVIYFVNGELYALDAKTGKPLWHFECPGAKDKSYDTFYAGVIGIDGKIFVRSGLHLYCYKVAE
jgi:outer membrane protein assembly factor BamB